MTHQHLIEKMLRDTKSKRFHENPWGIRHVATWNSPLSAEVGIVHLIEGAATYADVHRERYESKVGDDGILGPAWEAIVRSCLTMLNGELGRLDGGTLDKLLRDMLREEGIEPDV